MPDQRRVGAQDLRPSEAASTGPFAVRAPPTKLTAPPAGDPGIDVEWRSLDRHAPSTRTMPVLVSALSSIPAPAWMLRTPAPTPTDAERCQTGDYRPSGLLRLAAEQRRRAYFTLVRQIACEASVPPGLFDALIIRESAYNPAAASRAAAFGLTQLMAGTAAELGVNRFEVVANLRGGARYLRQQLDRFGQYPLALAAYNAGPARVTGRSIPAIAETRAYVAAVLGIWAQIERGWHFRPVLHP